MTTATTEFAPPAIRQTGILIGDDFRPAVSGRTFATVNPATESVICDVAEGDAADVDLALRPHADAILVAVVLLLQSKIAQRSSDSLVFQHFYMLHLFGFPL